MNVYAATVVLQEPPAQSDNVKITVTNEDGMKIGPVILGPIWIEAERWIDARTFARYRMGAEVKVSTVLELGADSPAYYPRWSIRFVGSAGGDPPVTMQARMLMHQHDGNAAPWTDVRDLA